MKLTHARLVFCHYRKADKQPYSPIFAISMIGGPQIVIPSRSTLFLHLYSSQYTFRDDILTFTVGQNKYDSVVSHQVEYAPIMTSLVGPKGKLALTLFAK